MVQVEAKSICLDTTFLIDFLRELPAAVEKAGELRGVGADLSTTSINIFETYLGAIRSTSRHRMARLEALLEDIRILPLGRREAEEAATILAELMKRGNPTEMRDALIAGCMLENACLSIVTRNVRDFSRVKNLEVLSY